MDINAIIEQVKSVYNGVSVLTILAVGVAIFTTTVAKEYMASKDKMLPVYAVRVWAFFVAVIMFVLLGWWAGQNLRDELFVVNAVGSGMAGPVIVWAGKKYLGIDLDDIMAGEKEKKDGIE